jgi:hypothetical protein
VRHANGRAADQINPFVLKFEQGSLDPDSARHSLLAHKAVGRMLLCSSQLYDHVRKFEEAFFGDFVSAAPSKRWPLPAEVEVFTRHLDETKEEVRLLGAESRFDAGVKLGPERLLVGRRPRLRQQHLDENEVWNIGRRPDGIGAGVIGEFGGR